MASNKYFFDANVIVEIALERGKMNTAIECLKAYSPNIYASTLSGHLTVHFGKKHTTLSAIEALLSNFDLLSLTADDFTWAFDLARNDDFEDALQIAVAIRNGCDTFVTFDKNLTETYNNLPTLKMKLLK